MAQGPSLIAPEAELAFGAETSLDDAIVSLGKDREDVPVDVPLKEMVTKALAPKKTASQRKLPPLIDHKGVVVMSGDDVDDDVNAPPPDAQGGLQDMQKLASTLSKESYDPLHSESQSQGNRIDFDFLKKLIVDSNLGTIDPVRASDSMKTGFMMTLKNKIQNYYTITHDDHVPVQVFSAFYPAFQHGILARESSGGTNVGWELIKTEMFGEGFRSVIDDCTSVPDGETPHLLKTCDHERVYIDPATAILLGWHGNLPFRRYTLSFQVEKTMGFITSFTISGAYEKAHYQTLIRGILHLLEDHRNFRDIMADDIRAIDKQMEDSIADLREGLSPEEIVDAYANLQTTEPAPPETVATEDDDESKTDE